MIRDYIQLVRREPLAGFFVTAYLVAQFIVLPILLAWHWLS